MYRNTIKPSTFFIELLLVFLKNISFAIIPTWPKLVFTEKTVIFFKKCRLNSNKNVLKRRNVPKYHKTKHIFHSITAWFSEKADHLQSY